MSNISPKRTIIVNADDYDDRFNGQFNAKIHALSVLAEYVIVYTTKRPDQYAAFAPLAKKDSNITVITQAGQLLVLPNDGFVFIDTLSWDSANDPTAPTPVEKAVDSALEKAREKAEITIIAKAPPITQLSAEHFLKADDLTEAIYKIASMHGTSTPLADPVPNPRERYVVLLDTFPKTVAPADIAPILWALTSFAYVVIFSNSQLRINIPPPLRELAHDNPAIVIQGCNQSKTSPPDPLNDTNLSNTVLRGDSEIATTMPKWWNHQEAVELQIQHVKMARTILEWVLCKHCASRALFTQNSF